jgi:hypothetical protein
MVYGLTPPAYQIVGGIPSRPAALDLVVCGVKLFETFAKGYMQSSPCRFRPAHEVW